MQKITVLPHQSEYMLAPYLFPEKRWFFFVCGYAAGKTKANVISLLYAVKQLQGKKDRSGDYARLIVAGYTLAHLNKTFLVYLRQILDQSKTGYTENKKDNFFIIGTVMVLVVPLENPENIFGFDAAACITADAGILCRRQGRVCRIRMKNVVVGDEVFTRKGWRKVLRVIPKGMKSAVRINHLVCTPDHKIWSSGWKDAETLGKGASTLECTIWRLKIWEITGTITAKVKESVSCLMESLITGIRMESTGAGKNISSALRGLVGLFFCILLFGRAFTEMSLKDLWYIIQTATRLIIKLIILKLCPLTNTRCFTTGYVCSTRRKKKNGGDALRRFVHTVERCLQSVVSCVVWYITQKPLVKNTAQKGVIRDGIKHTAGKRKGPSFARIVEMNLAHGSRKRLVSVVYDAVTLINTITEILRPSVIVKQGSVKYAGNTLLLPEILKRLPVLRTVKMLSGDKQYEVYDLTVDGHGAHEFFANGILVHNCFVEEIDELTEDKAIEAVRSLSERCRQQMPGFRSPFLCFASTSQGQKGLYRIYVHFKKKGVGFVLLRGRTQDNLFLPKELIKDMINTYTPEERRVFMDGEFLAIAKGRVLGDFNWERNYLDYDLDTELRPGETVYIGQDFNTGFSRASAYVVRDGVIYCIKYYDFPDPQDAPSVYRYDFPEQRILWIPDVTIKDSFPQFARELRKYGIQIIYRKKNPLVEDTVFLVNKLFYTSRLMVCKIAKDLAEACALAMRDKDNKIPKGLGPSSAMHTVDGLRYVCAFVCMKDKAFRDIRELIIDKRASFRSDSDKPVQDLGSGYIQIHPNALYRGKKL
jgi:hypothetical protein